MLQVFSVAEFIVTCSRNTDVMLQQRQEQERSTDKLIVSSLVNEAQSPNAVVRVLSDAVQQGSVSSVATMATGTEALPVRPLIPFAQGWLSGSSK